jgi:hypothetical protein
MTGWLPVRLPLDFEDQKEASGTSTETPAELRKRRVELRGVEPRTSCMPCKRSTS